MKSILCIALLAIPAAHAAPRPFSLKKTTSAPLKALPVTGHPSKEKVYVRASVATIVDKAKSAQAAKTAKSATPKVVQPRATAADPWHVTPKFEKGGKADSTFGFMLNHRF